MERPPSYSFRDAAMRANVRDWRSHETPSSAAPPEAPPGKVVAVAGAPVVERRRFSVGASFLGWSVAAFFTLVLSTAVAVVIGADASSRPLDLDRVGLGSLVGYLVASFAAYVIGGYAAGRLAPGEGILHGLLTVAWAVGASLLALVLAAWLADAYDLGAYLPTVSGTPTIGTSIAVLAALAAMLGGAALGGLLGERYQDRARGIEPRARGPMRFRGRPL